MPELYFGYGSNLCTDDLERWCAQRALPYPFVRCLGPAWAPDLELVFHYHATSRQGGALDLRDRPGQLAPGALFVVGERGWSTLDAKEGRGSNYEHANVTVLDARGGVHRARTYRVVEAARRGHFVRPRSGYVNAVRAGYGARGLGDLRQLEAAALGAGPPWEVVHLFTYGTLLRDDARFPLLAPLAADVIRPAHMPGRLVDMGAYPAALPPVGDERVVGELVRLLDPPTALAALDAIEGFTGWDAASLYHRVLATVTTDDGRTHRAFTYFLAEPGADRPPIASGSWRAHRAGR